jgi:hypothetical protein
MGGERHASATLTPGKTRYSLNSRLGGPQGRSGRVRKISLPPVFDLRTVQPVASRYTDCAIPAHTIRWIPADISPNVKWPGRGTVVHTPCAFIASTVTNVSVVLYKRMPCCHFLSNLSLQESCVLRQCMGSGAIEVYVNDIFEKCVVVVHSSPLLCIILLFHCP